MQLRTRLPLYNDGLSANRHINSEQIERFDILFFYYFLQLFYDSCEIYWFDFIKEKNNKKFIISPREGWAPGLHGELNLVIVCFYLLKNEIDHYQPIACSTMTRNPQLARPVRMHMAANHILGFPSLLPMNCESAKHRLSLLCSVY